MSIVQDHRASRDESPTEPTRMYRAARIDAREYSTDALLALADTFAIDATDPDPGFPGPVGRFLASERLRACRDELARRERLYRLNTGVPSPTDRRYEQWRSLAQLVRDRVDLVDVFEALAYQLHDTGPHEAHAACLVCGGVDRLVIRRDPPGRCWCRKCGWKGDVITVTMSLRQEGFRDATGWLANHAGIPVPEPFPAPGTPTSSGGFEFRGGKVVSR